MYVIKDRTGRGGNSITVYIKNQKNPEEKHFTITLAGLDNTAEADRLIRNSLSLYESRIKLSEVLSMLSAIRELSNIHDVKSLITEFTKRLKGDF